MNVEHFGELGGCEGSQKGRAGADDGGLKAALSHERGVMEGFGIKPEAVDSTTEAIGFSCGEKPSRGAQGATPFLLGIDKDEFVCNTPYG